MTACARTATINIDGQAKTVKYLDALGSVLAAKGLMLGDVNMDGRVTAFDARTVLQYSSELLSYSLQEAVLADVDYDGEITATDARIILRISAQLEEPLDNITEGEIV